MTDKELLELAAKAAVIQDFYYMSSERYTGLRYPNPKHGTKPYHEPHQFDWNPLTDDGDALRLAVKLNMRVEINQRSTVVYWIADESEKSVYEYPDSVQNADYEIQHINQDKATRRAIVRAAAEIGKEMK